MISSDLLDKLMMGLKLIFKKMKNDNIKLKLERYFCRRLESSIRSVLGPLSFDRYH